MSEQSYAMWRYWSGKYGAERALREYYPGVAAEPEMAAALMQMEAARLFIETRMQARADNEEAETTP